MDKTNEPKLNATNLKAALWNTLQAVQSGEISPKIANSVASQSRAILSVVSLQIRMESNKALSAKTKSFNK